MNEPDAISLPASDEEKDRQVRMLETGVFSEADLEVALIAVPELLDPPPFFCGRQIPTDSGVLDLLGLGKYNFPTVYELKARKIQRGDIAQVLDYVCWLDETDSETLTWHLIKHGREDNGIARFWNPLGLKNIIEEGRKFGAVSLPVIVGTDYDRPVERLAKRTEVQLLTISELCLRWRKEHETV